MILAPCPRPYRAIRKLLIRTTLDAVAGAVSLGRRQARQDWRAPKCQCRWRTWYMPPPISRTAGPVLLQRTDLDGLHPSFRFGPSLVDSVCRAHNGHRRLGRFLVDDGAFLGLDVLHNIELIGCESRNSERRNQSCCSN